MLLINDVNKLEKSTKLITKLRKTQDYFPKQGEGKW